MNLKFRNAAFSLSGTILAMIFPALCLAGTASEPGQAKEIKITARKYEFEPKTITVRKGETVKLVVTSEDVDHGIAISDFDIDVAVKAKQTKTVEFTPDKAGKFRVYCSVFCGDGHPDMEGELVVTEGDASSNIQVTFDEKAPGVVIVEANGERLRVDTTTKTVARLSEPAPTTATQSIIASERDERRPPTEPYDYRLVNVPTPKRVPRHSLNVHFTHRFSSAINAEGTTFTEQLEELFGLDSFSVSSFGLSYGITDRLYATFYRSPLPDPGLRKVIELGLGYHILDEAGRSPVALSAYASIEGNDNFSEEFTYNLQAMLARSVTKYANVFFSPAVHINTNGQGRFNPRLGDLFPLEPEAADFRLGKHTGSFGFGVNARVRPTVSLLLEYTPRVGFKLGRVNPIFSDDFTRIIRFENESEAEIGFGIEKRIGRHSFALTFSNTQTTTTSRYNSSNFPLPPSKFVIGFNLFRRLY